MKTLPPDNKFRCDACKKPALFESEASDVDAHPDTKPVTVRGYDFPAGMQPRSAVPKIRTCANHTNFPFSDDARAFASGKHPYSGRGVDPAETDRAESYKERV